MSSMTSLVLIQCERGRPVNGALSALRAVQPLGSIVVIACGDGAEGAAIDLALMPQVERVLTLDAANPPRAEWMAPLLIEQQQRWGSTHIVAAAGAWARGVLPRVAALLDVMALTEVVKIVDHDLYVRPVHAGAALMTLRLQEPVHVITVRSSAFEAPQRGAGPAATVERIVVSQTAERSVTLLERTEQQSGDTVELIGARVVVSGGRGIGSTEGFERLRPLAKVLNAAVGASRAAVDAGYAPADAQVGQSGKAVAPELYIALGISGAVQHWAGMKDSKVIVAINKDPEAPIFQFADYGLVADLFEVLPQLRDTIAALPPRS
jgi:electron transfer flavoprotein alpha subunit